MGDTAADKIPRDSNAEGSETTIGIKIKTLDSQTYTLRVDKQMPVPALKEQIASLTGVLSEQQRLICRGRVLKDDQLLSAYHVEDGHTLHLVVRQPVTPSTDSSPNQTATDSASGASRGQASHVAPSVVIETFNVPDQGDGVPPEISRIVSAVLGSVGFANFGSGSNVVDFREHASQRLERISGASGVTDSAQLQPEQASMRNQSDRPHGAFGLPTAVSLGPLQPPVIPDSLATLSQYLSHMRREFEGIGRGGGNDPLAAFISTAGHRDSNFASLSGTIREGLPTPASLAELLSSTRQMLVEQAGECLLQLARQLEDQGNVTEPSARMGMQSNAWRTGFLIHNLGSFLLELGRTTMTVRLGQTPSEAVVNAGPAVFISASGPNPLMVQPLPFQPGTSFGTIPTGSVQPGSGSGNGLGGIGLLPRRIDIQIRRGSSMATSNREERSDTQQPSGQRNPATGPGGENRSTQTTSRASESTSLAGESGVRVVPIRTMVAAVPASFGRLPSDSSGNSLGVYYPVLGRFQHIASGHVSGERGSQTSGEHLSAGVQTDQQLAPESTAPHQNTEEPTRDGSLPNHNSRQQERPNARSVNINIISAGVTQNNQESERQISGNFLQLLRTIFPGGEIHVEDGSSQGTASVSVPEHGSTSEGPPGAEPGVTEEGLLLSNLLHQVMPLIAQHLGSEQSDVAPEEENSSSQAENSNAGTSRRHSNSEPGPPNPKRRKME